MCLQVCHNVTQLDLIYDCRVCPNSIRGTKSGPLVPNPALISSQGLFQKDGREMEPLVRVRVAVAIKGVLAPHDAITLALIPRLVGRHSAQVQGGVAVLARVEGEIGAVVGRPGGDALELAHGTAADAEALQRAVMRRRVWRQ